jgi:hypothetical protein
VAIPWQHTHSVPPLFMKPDVRRMLESERAVRQRSTASLGDVNVKEKDEGTSGTCLRYPKNIRAVEQTGR